MNQSDISKVMESNNALLIDMFMKCHDVLSTHSSAAVSISGGGTRM